MARIVKRSPLHTLFWNKQSADHLLDVGIPSRDLLEVGVGGRKPPVTVPPSSLRVECSSVWMRPLCSCRRMLSINVASALSNSRSLTSCWHISAGWFVQPRLGKEELRAFLPFLVFLSALGIPCPACRTSSGSMQMPRCPPPCQLLSRSCRAIAWTAYGSASCSARPCPESTRTPWFACPTCKGLNRFRCPRCARVPSSQLDLQSLPQFERSHGILLGIGPDIFRRQLVHPDLGSTPHSLAAACSSRLVLTQRTKSRAIASRPKDQRFSLTSAPVIIVSIIRPLISMPSALIQPAS